MHRKCFQCFLGGNGAIQMEDCNLFLNVYYRIFTEGKIELNLARNGIAIVEQLKVGDCAPKSQRILSMCLQAKMLKIGSDTLEIRSDADWASERFFLNRNRRIRKM